MSNQAAANELNAIADRLAALIDADPADSGLPYASKARWSVVSAYNHMVRALDYANAAASERSLMGTLDAVCKPDGKWDRLFNSENN